MYAPSLACWRAEWWHRDGHVPFGDHRQLVGLAKTRVSGDVCCCMCFKFESWSSTIDLFLLLHETHMKNRVDTLARALNTRYPAWALVAAFVAPFVWLAAGPFLLVAPSWESHTPSLSRRASNYDHSRYCIERSVPN